MIENETGVAGAVVELTDEEMATVSGGEVRAVTQAFREYLQDASGVGGQAMRDADSGSGAYGWGNEGGYSAAVGGEYYYGG